MIQFRDSFPYLGTIEGGNRWFVHNGLVQSGKYIAILSREKLWMVLCVNPDTCDSVKKGCTYSNWFPVQFPAPYQYIFSKGQGCGHGHVSQALTLWYRNCKAWNVISVWVCGCAGGRGGCALSKATPTQLRAPTLTQTHKSKNAYKNLACTVSERWQAGV